ncbi:hypothetical protein ACKFKG_03145 [Phormidesmis sp. 146-35]
MADQINSDSLSQLVRMAEIQLELSQQQRESIDALSQAISQGFNGLREVVERQAETATRQQQTIQQFASILGETTRAVSELSRTVRESVESSRRSAQAAESSAFLAQANQNAIRDLIDEMRDRRSEG